MIRAAKSMKTLRGPIRLRALEVTGPMADSAKCAWEHAEELDLRMPLPHGEPHPFSHRRRLPLRLCGATTTQPPRRRKPQACRTSRSVTPAGKRHPHSRINGPGPRPPMRCCGAHQGVVFDLCRNLHDRKVAKPSLGRFSSRTSDANKVGAQSRKRGAHILSSKLKAAQKHEWQRSAAKAKVAPSLAKLSRGSRAARSTKWSRTTFRPHPASRRSLPHGATADFRRIPS